MSKKNVPQCGDFSKVPQEVLVNKHKSLKKVICKVLNERKKFLLKYKKSIKSLQFQLM